jgi:hypothetical protein
MPKRHQPPLVTEHAQIGPVMPSTLHAWMLLEVGTLRQGIRQRGCTMRNEQHIV